MGKSEVVHRTPLDLSEFVGAFLQARSISVKPAHLRQLFSSLFFLSLKSEEGQPLSCAVLFEPSPSPGRRHAPGTFVQFGRPLLFTNQQLEKLARAVDPRVAALIVNVNSESELVIGGIADQFPLHLQRYRSWETDRVARLPKGLFAEIMAPGEIRVYWFDRVLATLRQDKLTCRENDALWHGPLLKALSPYIGAFQKAVRTKVGKENYASYGDWFKGTDEEDEYKNATYDNEMMNLWLGTLARILLRIQRYRQGGAILLIPQKARTPDLSIKYELQYGAIETYLVHYAEAYIRQSRIEAAARFGTLDTLRYDGKPAAQAGCFVTPDGRENIFMTPKLQASAEAILRSWNYTAERTDAMAGLAGAVSLCSSLTRVDGLVLFVGGMRTRGFGVEIRTKRESSIPFAAANPDATEGELIDRETFGTRHRSMMRFCDAHPGTVGFVVSHDGEIRAFCRIERRLLMWENLLLTAGVDDFYLYHPRIVEQLPEIFQKEIKRQNPQARQCERQDSMSSNP